MTNSLPRTEADPKPALGLLTTAHIGNQYDCEHIEEPTSKEDPEPISVLLFSPRDPEELMDQLGTLTDATGMTAFPF